MDRHRRSHGGYICPAPAYVKAPGAAPRRRGCGYRVSADFSRQAAELLSSTGAFGPFFLMESMAFCALAFEE